MKNKINLYILVFSICIPQNFIPENGSVLNYKQIYFKWPQISENQGYIIDLNGMNYYSENNSIIIDNLEWNQEYSWQVCALTNDENQYCNLVNNFSINQLPVDYPNNINVLLFDEEQCQNGITIIDYESINYAVAVDMYGNPIWFAKKDNFFNSRILISQLLSNGNLVGFGAGYGYEFDLNSNIVYQSLSEYDIHHHFYKTENDSYFFIDAEVENLPCPEECNDELPSEVPWQGDRFIELDMNGDELWNWNTFEYLSQDEYNPYWAENYSGENDELDWTHSNSVFFDVNENLVYLSLRNLSRITAIDYSSKEIVWNLGNSDFMENVYFENDFGFSHQHSAQKTYNNNLLFFDNGRGNDPELSRCLEIEMPIDDEPQLLWEYILPDSLHTLSRGECDRLTNDNTLISAGRTGNVIEVNNSNEIVWHLNAKNNGSAISIYRSERIENLHPNIFSYEILNLSGEYGNYFIDYFLNELSLVLYNKGWENQIYHYQLFADNDFLILENYLEVSAYEQEYFNIILPQEEYEFYNLNIYPVNNIGKTQNISFSRIVNMGDINGDLIIDILDVILLINIILYVEAYDSIADINNDNEINILDLVELVNIILHE